jgi:far upstream element-binding protein
MQSTTGCKINVSQASGADIEREIGLVGTRQAIDDAKKAIWEKVDSVVSTLLFYSRSSTDNKQKEKNGGGYGNRRGGGGGRDQGSYNDNYSQPQQTSYEQPQAQASAQGAAAADPYAAYGGYQQYLAMWYQAYGQQQQAGGQGPPPGAAS